LTFYTHKGVLALDLLRHTPIIKFDQRQVVASVAPGIEPAVKMHVAKLESVDDPAE
jgi:hypothetical protein